MLIKKTSIVANIELFMLEAVVRAVTCKMSSKTHQCCDSRLWGTRNQFELSCMVGKLKEKILTLQMLISTGINKSYYYLIIIEFNTHWSAANYCFVRKLNQRRLLFAASLKFSLTRIQIKIWTT